MPEKKSIKREVTAGGQQSVSGKAQAVIYLGPAIAGVAMPGTVYRNGLPPLLTKAKEELSALSSLLVETKEAARVRKALKDPNSAASICYQKVLEYAKKKGAEG